MSNIQDLKYCIQRELYFENFTVDDDNVRVYFDKYSTCRYYEKVFKKPRTNNCLMNIELAIYYKHKYCIQSIFSDKLANLHSLESKNSFELESFDLANLHSLESLDSLESLESFDLANLHSLELKNSLESFKLANLHSFESLDSFELEFKIINYCIIYNNVKALKYFSLYVPIQNEHINLAIKMHRYECFVYMFNISFITNDTLQTLIVYGSNKIIQHYCCYNYVFYQPIIGYNISIINYINYYYNNQSFDSIFDCLILYVKRQDVKNFQKYFIPRYLIQYEQKNKYNCITCKLRVAEKNNTSCFVCSLLSALIDTYPNKFFMEVIKKYKLEKKIIINNYTKFFLRECIKIDIN